VPKTDNALSRDELIWRIVAAIGLVFLLLGLLDIALTWFPLDLGDSEWELGTTSHFFDTFPLLGLGISFLLATSIAEGRRWQARTLATFCVLLAVFMWLALALYVTVLPVAFKAIGNSAALTPIKKAGAKTAVQALIYPFALLWLAGAAWRASLRKRSGGY
jgi:hypothetical protein